MSTGDTAPIPPQYQEAYKKIAARKKATPECHCWIVHVHDPAGRARIEAQIEVEREHHKRSRNRKRKAGHLAVIMLLSEQLKPCPGAAGKGEA